MHSPLPPGRQSSPGRYFANPRGGVVKFSAPTSHGAILSIPSPPAGNLATAQLTLLVFLPFAFSPVCGGEVRELQQRRQEIERAGAQIVGISCDSVVALRAWGIAEGIEFDLLSDFWPHGQIAQELGAFDEKAGRPRRHTLLIDAAGKMRARWEYPAGEARPVDEYLDVIGRVVKGELA